ncbi:hypothetical protein ACFY8O_12545 [Streptomyces argenteolus]|uniref:Uncharacterized protein n=1 Tax=Streptomyces argenteolus TaxID=67274 RepID=A0ABW6X3T5_9ACTN
MVRRWTGFGAWVVWWAVITAVFWLLGEPAGRSSGLRGCAVTAAFVIVVGECGDRLRRRWASRRPGAREGDLSGRR